MRSLALTATLLVSGALLGACSFQPVYSGALASQPLLNLAYAKPANRLEQIVYQELSLRLGSSTSETAPLAQVSVSVGLGGIGGLTATGNPSAPSRATATATLTITQRDGSTTKPLVITRVAIAQYSTNSQVFANNTAATEASERAAKAAAESLRLALLATLSR
jgi:hypothetical protein